MFLAINKTTSLPNLYAIPTSPELHIKIATGSPHAAFKHTTPNAVVNATVFTARAATDPGLSGI